MSPSSDHGRQSPLILVVDDAEQIRYVRRRILSQAGYQVIEVSTGEEALSLAISHQPDLIVLYVGLPGIDGLEVCRCLKADPKTAQIMVLQVSSARASKIDLAGLEGGANGYLIEPIDPLELLATVKALLRLADRERRLRRSERQFAEATEAADCGLWDWDIANGKLEWFGAHERLAGMVPGGFSGKIGAFSDILHPDDRTRVWNKLQSMMAEGEEHFSDEYRFVHPDGSVHWMTAKCRFFYDEAGHAVRMTGVVQDITERKRAEEQLKENHRFISEMTSTIPGVLYIFDLDERRNIYVNRHTGTVLGYSPEEVRVMGADFIPAVLHPDDASRLHQHFQRLKELADGVTAQVEYRFRHRDGSYRWFLSRDVAWQRAADGHVCQILGTATDITERKQIEEALKLRDRALSASEAGVLIVDATAADLPIIFASSGFERLTGYRSTEVVGRNCRFLQGPATDRTQVARIREALEAENPLRLVLRNYRKDGTPFWNDLAIPPCTMPPGISLILSAFKMT